MSYELPDYMHSEVHSAVQCEQLAAERKSLWAVQLGLVPKQDGNQWCVLYGENLQEGIAAFGDTPSDAMYHFEEAMASKKGSRP